MLICSINPITGSYEPERPNPLEQMSEEQKEFEAVKLVNMIDQLQRFAWIHIFIVYSVQLFIQQLAFTGKESFNLLESARMESLAP